MSQGNVGVNDPVQVILSDSLVELPCGDQRNTLFSAAVVSNISNDWVTIGPPMTSPIRENQITYIWTATQLITSLHNLGLLQNLIKIQIQQ